MADRGTVRRAGALLWLRGLVRLGLAEYARRVALPAADVAEEMAAEARSLIGRTDWAEALRVTRSAWPLRGSRLGKAIAELDLTPAEGFVLVLTGEVEGAHSIDIALTELQAPSGGARPTANLCAELASELFGTDALSPEKLDDLPLLRAGIVALDGPGPTPLRYLRIEPNLWSVLSDGLNDWPDCPFIERAPAKHIPVEARREAPKIAGLMKTEEVKGLALRGNPGTGRLGYAELIARRLGKRAIAAPLDRWAQEPALAAACRIAGWLPVLRATLGPGEELELPPHTHEQPVIVVLGASGAVTQSGFVELSLGVPGERQRRSLWRELLHDRKLGNELGHAALLSGPAIVRIAEAARFLAERSGEPLARHHVREARAAFGGDRLRLLAQPVEREVPRDAIVLSAATQRHIEALVERAERREALWQGLGATMNATRTTGVKALFVGESGTGKSLAASHVATLLGAPMYRVDLAAVMNKYLGESEKNLSLLLEEAAANDCVLCCDEADSLFGRRSDGKDSGQRFATMLTNFLLTRIETHPGVVILTTNSRERIDPAFIRRLDYAVEFTLPRFAERLELWNTHLGPLGPDEDTRKLLASYCDLPGGHIRNIVVNAAARPRRAGRRISIDDLVESLRDEYRKLGRPSPPRIKQLVGR